MWEEMGWDEKSWDEVRWEELTWFEMRWSVECDVQVWSASVKCEECSVKCEESVCLALHCAGVVAQVMFLDNICATASHKARTHGPGWRSAHANSIDGKGLIVYPWGNFRPASCGYYWYMINKHVYQYLYIYSYVYIYIYVYVCIYVYVQLLLDMSEFNHTHRDAYIYVHMNPYIP